jgi:hypothetical protein
MTKLMAVLLTTATILSPMASGAGPSDSALRKCAADAVVSGTVCMDKYEASVWRVPNPTTTNRSLVARIQAGRVRSGAELVAAGATELVGYGAGYAPCASNGEQCGDVFAVSIQYAAPSRLITWFQAQQACKNSRKRLPSNTEWQAAVAGTPDPGPDDRTTTCATTGFGLAATGTRTTCVSADGVFDMVGNVAEWVADWVPRSETCGDWGSSLSPTGDGQCLAGATTYGEPGALLRGGLYQSGTEAGPLWIHGGVEPSFIYDGIGFRCAR